MEVRPCALAGLELKRPRGIDGSATPGVSAVLSVRDDGLWICCADACVELCEVLLIGLIRYHECHQYDR
jgi:hypothetical protein